VCGGVSDTYSFGMGETGLDDPGNFFSSSQDSSEVKSNQGSVEMEDLRSSKMKAKRKTKLEGTTTEIRKQEK